MPDKIKGLPRQPTSIQEAEMPVVVPLQFRFDCPLCAWPITLPRLSSLGRYLQDRFLPDVLSWQWICTGHEQVCECSLGLIECVEFEEQPDVKHPTVMWSIEHSCRDCHEKFTGFTWWNATGSYRPVLVNRLAEIQPDATCRGGHKIVWQPQCIEAAMLPF